MSKKRSREEALTDTQLIEIYEDLANLDGNIRIKAAHRLLTTFIAGHGAHETQVHTILKRLLRGLCSGRKAARLGFSVALTECLIALFGSSEQNASSFYDISGILQILEDQTQVSKGSSGQVSQM